MAPAPAQGEWDGWSKAAATAAMLEPDFRAAMLNHLRVLVVAFDNLADAQRRKVASGATDLVRNLDFLAFMCEPCLDADRIMRMEGGTISLSRNSSFSDDRSWSGNRGGGGGSRSGSVQRQRGKGSGGAGISRSGSGTFRSPEFSRSPSSSSTISGSDYSEFLSRQRHQSPGPSRHQSSQQVRGAGASPSASRSGSRSRGVASPSGSGSAQRGGRREARGGKRRPSGSGTGMKL